MAPYLPDETTIEPAHEADAPLIHELICELARYEKLSHEVEGTEEDLRRTLFGPRPFAEALIARFEGEPAGFALFFHNYSTFLARPGIYLEDLFVRPAFRGKRIGKALLVQLAKLARERGCGRIEWWVLDWNVAAIEFYKSIRAQSMDDWTVYRMDAEAIDALAGWSIG